MSAKELEQIRAFQDERTVRVYQAFGAHIADSALTNGRFISPPFNMKRMTWIKPSFLWMMYRCGWGFKEPMQSRILAIDICREGMRWALENSVRTDRKPAMAAVEYKRLKELRPVRVQWDPERDLDLRPLSYRTIQIGLSGQAVDRYVGEWIKSIMDITALAHAIHDCLRHGDRLAALELLPNERVLEL